MDFRIAMNIDREGVTFWPLDPEEGAVRPCRIFLAHQKPHPVAPDLPDLNGFQWEALAEIMAYFGWPSTRKEERPRPYYELTVGHEFGLFKFHDITGCFVKVARLPRERQPEPVVVNHPPFQRPV